MIALYGETKNVDNENTWNMWQKNSKIDHWGKFNYIYNFIDMFFYQKHSGPNLD